MNTQTIKITLVALSLLGSAACLSSTDTQPVVDGDKPANNGAANNGAPIQDPAPTDIMPELPEGVNIGGGALFRVNKTTPTFETPVAGNASFILHGVLADTDGRRELRFFDRATRQKVTIAPATWNLPPTGAVDASGDVLVCWNHLTGGSSPLTEGPMADPTQGVSLLCRRRAGDSWGETFRVAAAEKAAWVRRVVATPSGFRLMYYADDGWFMAKQDGGRNYAVTIGPEGPGVPELIP